MKTSTNTDIPDLETEYLRIKVILYRNLFLYCAIIALIIATKEAIRAIYFGRFGAFVVLAVFLGFGSFLFYFIWNLKTNQEFIITVYLALFFLSSLLSQYYTNSGYFDDPKDSFNMAYAYAVCERLIMSRISKFSHRIHFIGLLTGVRVIVIPANNIGLFLMQFVYLFFTVYLDMDKEKYDKDFFRMYFRNKEQLLKFKNLLVQDIPESIIIITQDLMQTLFINNSFEQLLGENETSEARSKLKQFYVSENLENSHTDSLSTSDRPRRRQSLLEFLEAKISNQANAFQTQKFSCNLSYRKLLEDNELDQEPVYQEYMFEAKAIYLLWDDQPAVALVLHDITEQHTILSLKIADAHKDTILATVSHELRTPLNGILGMIQIMQKRVLERDMLNYLNICKNSGDLLLSLVNSILDLNQIRAKKLKLCIEKVNIIEMLENIVRLFEFQCNHKGIYLKLKVSSTCPASIITDKNRLSQIFINLVGNALKFTQTGGITISAFGVGYSEHLTFSVEDTGTGVRDEDKKKLFTMFGKLEQSDRNVNPHGVGLGLTISDKLVRLLNGNARKEGIQLESQYGKGSKFTFSVRKTLRETYDIQTIEVDTLGSELSRRSTDERGEIQNKMLNYSREYVKSSKRFTTINTRTKPDSLNENLDCSLSSCIYRNGGHSDSLVLTTHNNHSLQNIPHESGCVVNPLVTPYVLIVDDNPLNIVIAESLISSHGFKVKSALYGQVGIDMVLNCNYEREPIKLILMDCQMPVMDGFTVTRALKDLMGKKKIPEIPIVALTANDGEMDREESRKAGMCEHMTKPLKEMELVRLLNRYITQ